MKSKYLLIVVILLLALIAVVFFVGLKGVFFLKEKEAGARNDTKPKIENHSV